MDSETASNSEGRTFEQDRAFKKPTRTKEDNLQRDLNFDIRKTENKRHLGLTQQIFEDIDAVLGQTHSPSETRDAGKRWVNAFPWEDIILGHNLGGAPEEDPLNGDLGLVQNQVKRRSEYLADDLTGFRRFLIGPLAEALDRLEAATDGTYETRSDLVIVALAENEAWVPHNATYAPFLAGLRNYLERQPDFQRGAGWFVTLTMLGDLAFRDRNRQGRRYGWVYYHEVLAAGPERTGSSINVVANNLAGRVLDSRDAPALARAVANRVDALSVVTETPSVPQGNIGDRLIARLGEVLVESRPGNLPPPDAIGVWLGMAKIPSSWSYIAEEVCTKIATREKDGRWMASFGMIAGAFASVLEEDRERVAAAFFNAGVSLLRDDEATSLVLLRITANALGMIWAFRIAGDNPSQALGELNGIDCAVNLFGALSKNSEARTAPEYRTLCQDLCNALQAWRDRLPSPKKAEYFRLESSWREIGINARRLSSPPSSGEFIGLTMKTLAWVLSSELPRETEAALTGNDDNSAADATLRLALFALGIVDRESRDTCIRDLFAIAESLLELRAQGVEAAWQHLYGEWAIPSGGAAVDARANPYVAAGLLTPDEWTALAKEARGPEVTSLAEWLKREGTLSWLG